MPTSLQSSPDTAPPSAPFGRQENLPQVFGRYLLIQRLSRGGMGEIFLAKHGLAGFEKLAVIKKVLPHLAADAQFISRFVDEAQVAIKLSHVNVAQVFEVGRVGDEYFLALEYIDGRDLRRTLARLAHHHQRLPVDLALFIARDIANGLAYAHRRTTSDGAPLNLVHCDISPPNVLVSFEGETKIIDFGIAKSVMRETETDPKVGFGKFGYMSPEQLIRGGQIDHRTDIYAAGVVLFELITGTRLYEAGPEPDYRTLARKVARGEHPLPSDIDPVLAPYDDLVATALRPKAEDRYQSAAELRDAIQHCLVAINPTISTDQLGDYMRELFVDEMLAQRELHERAASAHLADFQEQLHTQTISTVSFAVAQLPLPPPAPDATGRIRVQQAPPSVRHRTTGPNPVAHPGSGRHAAVRATGPSALVRTTGTHAVPSDSQRSARLGGAPRSATAPMPRPSPAFDTMAPPTGALEPMTPEELDLAPLASSRHPAAPPVPPPAERSMTELAVPRAPAIISLRRRSLIIALVGAIAVVGGVATWRGLREAPSPAPAIATPVAVPTVEPIVVAQIAPPRAQPAPAQPAPAQPSHVAVVEPSHVAVVEPARVEPAPARPVDPHPRRPTRPPAPVHKDPKPAASLTRDQLGQKFRQVRREYDDYKLKYGSRLEREWGDLTTSIQYMSADDDGGRREAARRLDEFRQRMKD